MSLTRRFSMLVLLPVLLALGLIIALASASRQIGERTEELGRGQKVLVTYGDVVTTTLAIDLWARSYVATKKSRDHEYYNNAVLLAPVRGRMFMDATAFDPALADEAREIVSLGNAILTPLVETVDLAADGNFAAAQAELALDLDEPLLARFRAVRAPFVEKLRAKQILDENALATTQQRWGFIVDTSIIADGIASALIIGLALSMMSAASTRMRRISEQVKRLASGEPLDTIDDAHDELGALDRTIQRIAVEVRSKNALLTRYSLLAESATDACIFIDGKTNRIVDGNAAALAMYGYTYEEFTRLQAVDLRPPASPLTEAAWLEAGRRGDYQTIHEAASVRKDGTVFPVEFALRVENVDGSPMVLIVGRDITKRHESTLALSRALDDAVKASELKARFVASVSHEIRTPMNGIIGMTELALRTQLDETQREYLQTVNVSAHSLLNIINDILDFSKLEAGKIELEQAEFDIAPLVESVVALVSGSNRRETVTLTTYIGPEVPRVVRGDAGRLRQILTNLVGNALKFTEAGHVRTSVEAGEMREGRATLTFKVTDTGIGMTPEAIEKVFLPFVQADASTTRRFGGTGLGLVITKSLVDLMGGSIRIESLVNSGTQVTLVLSIDAVDAQRDLDAIRPPGDEAAALERFDGIEVLVAEDNPVNRRVAERQLSTLGCRSTMVGNGAEAVEISGREHFAVIFMDCQMPVLDGLSATRAIREREAAGGLPRIPIVAMTANASPADRDRCLDAGMDDYLSKPVVLGSLAAILVRLGHRPASVTA